MNTLHTIITREIDIYTYLIQLEEQKKEAIVTFNGDALFSLSKEQEKSLLELERLEKERQLIIKNNTKNRSLGGDITLKEFIALEKGSKGDATLALAMDLKAKIEKFARLYETNKKLIDDNLEFFNVIVTLLRKAVTIEAGYGPEGITKRSAGNAVLMNTRA